MARKLQNDIDFQKPGTGNLPDFRTVSDYRNSHVYNTE